MALLSSFKREPVVDTPPLSAVAFKGGTDYELGLKYRVSMMMHGLTEHIIREVEADLTPLPDGEDLDDYYVQKDKLAKYAADLLYRKQDPDYEFNAVPELRLPVIQKTD